MTQQELDQIIAMLKRSIEMLEDYEGVVKKLQFRIRELEEENKDGR